MFVVFLGVVSSVVCYGVFESKTDANVSKATINDYAKKSVFVSVRNSESKTLEANMVVIFDPKDLTIDLINIPKDTKVRIAGSDQMFADVMNIGEFDILHQCVEQIIPMPVENHLIISSDDMSVEDDNYIEIIRYIFDEHIWCQNDLSEYISRFLNVSSTDLTLVKAQQYAGFLEKFRGVTPEYHTLPGERTSIGEKTFYVIVKKDVIDFINEVIFD